MADLTKFNGRFNTMTDLAKAVGRSRPHVSRVMRGSRQYSGDLISRLAKAMRVSEGEVVEHIKAARVNQD